jgi:hypothetical protein
MNKLNLDIIYLIFGFLDFLSKIRFRSISKYMYKLQIHDFYNISNKYLKLLDDKILLNYPFITYLNAFNNLKITNKGIEHLNLIKLNAAYNPNITNINHMANYITELDASGEFCGITDKGIANLKNLIKLNAFDNSQITNINHMNKLVELCASGEFCGISNAGIKELKNLKEIIVFKNNKITLNNIYNSLKI